MSKLPSKIKIGPRHYSVKQTPTDHLKSEEKAGQRLWGYIDTNEMRIVMDPSLSPARTKEILIHECLHGIISNTGGLTTNDSETEDGVINRLQTGLLALLQDNPTLVKYLSASDGTS